MLKLFGKQKADTAVYNAVHTDMHSHLIPGIDDGAPDVETSLELIRGLLSIGFKKIITTPHILWDMYKNSYEIITEKTAELNEAIVNEGLDIEIKAGAEYFLDDHVAGLLKDKKPLLTIGDNMVLVEFSLVTEPLDLKEILFELQMAGYQPVIAHPERYIYLQGNREFFQSLKDAGYYFQANLLSFGNYYGKAVCDLANYLASKDFYDFVGTDLHNARYMEALSNPSITNAVKKLLSTGKLKNPEL